MPSAISAPQVVIKNQDQVGYIWAKSDDGSLSMSRRLTNFERMFVIFNQELYGQNCPFMGATLSLQRQDQSHSSSSINLSGLHKRAIEAFSQTRWKYPTVAARVVDGDKALYPIDCKTDIQKWAERTVRIISQEGGWLALRDRLSRESPIPTSDGDYCIFYLIVRPDEVEISELTTFDVLMHTHHVFTDGSGIKSILHEFLRRLSDPLDPEEIIWGEEVHRLLPASLLLEKEEDEETSDDKVKLPGNQVRLKGFSNSDIGLPVFRPEIKTPMPDYRGTLLVSHTFPSHSFLPQLLDAGRKHGVKLASLLHAALLKAIYDFSSLKPGAEDVYKSGSALDLRNGYMIPEYAERYKYVNSAVAIQPIEVPCSVFFDTDGADGIWKAAKCISDQWDTIKKKTGVAKAVESDAKTFIESWNSKETPPQGIKPRTCPYFVSDPPGSQHLSSIYPINRNCGDLSFILKSYQLATDQSQAVISARSHSWNDYLTLCLAFNSVRNPKKEMQRFLDTWVRIVEDICTMG